MGTVDGLFGVMWSRRAIPAENLHESRALGRRRLCGGRQYDRGVYRSRLSDRYRISIGTCTNPAPSGGADCVGDDSMTEECTAPDCSTGMVGTLVQVDLATNVEVMVQPRFTTK